MVKATATSTAAGVTRISTLKGITVSQIHVTGTYVPSGKQRSCRRVVSASEIYQWSKRDGIRLASTGGYRPIPEQADVNRQAVESARRSLFGRLSKRPQLTRTYHTLPGSGSPKTLTFDSKLQRYTKSIPYDDHIRRKQQEFYESLVRKGKAK